MIEVGMLLRMASTGSFWIALDEIEESVLVVNQKTNYKMWAWKHAFEVME
jgi:hypothetical protein